MSTLCHKISINRKGQIKFIYSDSLNSLLGLGQATIERVSNVEPRADGQWEARMIDGTVLGPFKLREQALLAELDYLDKTMFPRAQE